MTFTRESTGRATAIARAKASAIHDGHDGVGRLTDASGRAPFGVRRKLVLPVTGQDTPDQHTR